MKICTKCKVEKDEDLFNNNITRNDGLSSWCKKCSKEYKENNKERTREVWAKYHERNKDKINELNAKYREENKEKVKESNVKSKAKNKERIKKTAAEYRANNREKFHAYGKERAKNLVDSYLLNLIRQRTSLKVNEIPKVLIEAKRMHILIKRTIKEMI